MREKKRKLVKVVSQKALKIGEKTSFVRPGRKFSENVKKGDITALVRDTTGIVFAAKVVDVGMCTMVELDFSKRHVLLNLHNKKMRNYDRLFAALKSYVGKRFTSTSIVSYLTVEIEGVALTTSPRVQKTLL